MKATRILLFLSPLLWFAPSLIPLDDNAGLMMLNMMYKGLLAKFPWNALMAFLCYTYARQLGREAWPWVTGSLVFPFFAPFILAFMPAKYGSSADEQRRGHRAPAPAKAAEGPFDSRFPLLAAHLQNLPQAARMEPRARMDLVRANFEFSAFLPPGTLDAFLAAAAARSLTVWADRAEEAGVRVFGAGMVEAVATDNITTWLRQAGPTRKVATAVHRPDGPTKFFEYYPSAS